MRVHWRSTFDFLQELLLCIHNLANRHKRPSFQPVSAFDMPSSLGLIITIFLFKVRDVGVFLSLEHLEGHCMIIIWCDFNTVVSQGTGRPEARERGARKAGCQSSQNMHCVY